MKNIVFIVALFVTACTGNTKTGLNESTNLYSSVGVNAMDTLKKISDIKLALLDARNEKAEILLGKPDVKGRIMMGNFYYMVYYSKVVDAGKVKHLALFIDGKSGINDASTIYKIAAVNDGETIQRAGNFAQWLQVSKVGLKSNAMDFSYGSGKNSWSDVEATGSGKIEPRGNMRGDTKLVASLNDLPIPADAIKMTQSKNITLQD